MGEVCEWSRLGCVAADQGGGRGGDCVSCGALSEMLQAAQEREVGPRESLRRVGSESCGTGAAAASIASGF
eukprot:1299707-Rhodomonas_salina.2